MLLYVSLSRPSGVILPEPSEVISSENRDHLDQVMDKRMSGTQVCCRFKVEVAREENVEDDSFEAGFGGERISGRRPAKR